MKTKEIEKNCQGQCVKCMSENIIYDTFEHEGEYGYYKYTCQDCSDEGREHYNIIYDLSETTIEIKKDEELSSI